MQRRVARFVYDHQNTRFSLCFAPYCGLPHSIWAYWRNTALEVVVMLVVEYSLTSEP